MYLEFFVCWCVMSCHIRFSVFMSVQHKGRTVGKPHKEIVLRGFLKFLLKMKVKFKMWKCELQSYAIFIV